MSALVDTYIQSQPKPQNEICTRLREIILDTFPGIDEGMKWGVPAFEDGFFYIAALKDHVNLGFSISNLTKEKERMFQGGGKTTKKIELFNLDDINE